MKTKLNGILTLLLALVVQVAFAQQTVTGKVTGPDGDGVIGATVSVKGTSTFASTDFNGNYTIQAESDSTLSFSYSGYDTQEVVVGNQTVINVTMSANELATVIVRAYGTQTTKKNVSALSIVEADAIEDIPANSPQELLQGQAGGVQVVQSSGVLGAAPVINIRGTATISSGSQPLFVIDGVPLSDTQLTSGQGGQSLNPLANINPNDIESFSVLKDAAATAIYGSRGANGVVLITTKGGKKNQATRVRLDVSTGFTRSTDELDVLSADEYRQFAVDASRWSGVTDITTLPQGGFDWADAVGVEGSYENIDVSVTGGGEKTSFFVSANVKNETGFIIGNGLKRRATRINLNHDAKEWLTIGANLSYSFVDNDRVGSENNVYAPFTSAYLMLPWNEPRNADGEFQNVGFIRNVLAVEALDINRSTQSRLNGRLYATVNILDGLDFTSSFGMDRIAIEEQERSFDVNSPGGTATSFFALDNRFIVSNNLDYTKTFAEKHDVNVILGATYEEIRNRNLRADGTNINPALINVRSAANRTTGGNFDNQSQLQGYFSRASYSYDDKYLLEGSLRTDGSSRFGRNNRFGTFYSAAVGWNISEEAFMEDVSWINNLKLRGSYGKSGNDRIGNFAAIPTFGGSSYNNNPSLILNNIGNPDLKWESTKGLNIGLAGDLFNNRIRFSVDYYKNNTDDLIINVPTSYSVSTGPNAAIRNVGEVENKGYDVSLAADIFRDGDFKWTASFNAGFNKNEVISLPGASLDENGVEFIPFGTTQRAIVGESLNTFYLIRYVGVNSQTGDAEWLDADGNITTTPGDGDRVVVGQANPDIVGGITNTFRYKGFDLNIISNFSYGNDILLDGLRFTDNVANFGFNNRRRTLDVWQNPGDNAFVPSFESDTFDDFDQRSTAQLKDGSFLRVKNVTLGYTLPQDLLGKLDFFTSVRLYGTATNLLTIKSDELDGFDPEVTDTQDALGQGESFFTAPQSRSYIFGATFNF